MKIKVGVSARHAHLSKEDLEILFGEGYELTKVKDLSQKTDFYSDETISIKSNDKILENVRIIGPTRDKTQVEVSKTDSYYLGQKLDYKSSGELDTAGLVTLIGPKGKVEKECLILPVRHIHMTEEDSKKLNLSSNDLVQIKVDGEKGGILNNVHIKIHEKYSLELHLDLDDANAHDLKNGDEVEIIYEEI